jgi:hypothetical protein
MKQLLQIECHTCKWGGLCKHPLRKDFNGGEFCLIRITGDEKDPHPKYPWIKKVRSYYEYSYWEPKRKETCNVLLTDKDFEL